MKSFIVFVVIIGLVLARPSEDKYETKYDNVDWRGILSNERLARNYMDCLLDIKSCPNDGAYLKSIIPEALKTECAKCSDKQKEAVKEALTTIYKKKPEWWTELENKYDQDRVYFKKYEQALKSAAAQI